MKTLSNFVMMSAISVVVFGCAPNGKDKEKELEQLAENISAEVVMVSTDHPDGDQFLNLTKGVGALLRFALE